MTAVAGLTSAAASFLSAEMYGHWPWIPETMPLPEQLVAEYFAASDPLSRCGAFRNRGLAQRQCRGGGVGRGLGDGVDLGAAVTVGVAVGDEVGVGVGEPPPTKLNLPMRMCQAAPPAEYSLTVQNVIPSVSRVVIV